MNLTPILPTDRRLLLLNCMYVAPYYEFDANGKKKKVSNDFLYMVYRDMDTGEKHVAQIEDPQTDTFITLPEYRQTFGTQRKFLEVHKLAKYQVPYSRITNFIKNVITEDGVDLHLLPIIAKSPKEGFKWRHSYFADYNICDYAMMTYLLNNEEYVKNGIIEDTHFSRGYLDIESDVYGLTTAEMDECKAPINAVTVIFDSDRLGRKYDHPHVHTFLLRNHQRYKDQAYFETHMEEFIEQCHDEFDAKYNSPEFRIYMFDYERDLLKALFKLIHLQSPDFMQIWN